MNASFFLSEEMDVVPPEELPANSPLARGATLTEYSEWSEREWSSDVDKDTLAWPVMFCPVWTEQYIMEECSSPLKEECTIHQEALGLESRQITGGDAVRGESEREGSPDAAPPRSSVSKLEDEWLMSALADDERRADALASMKGHVQRLAFEPLGCRAVQLALEVAALHTARDLARELVGHALRGVQSPHCNYVLQKVVELLPAQYSCFVAEELSSFGGTVARNRFGCRVLCRMLEHFATEAATSRLLDEVIDQASEICRNKFARYVLVHVLEFGLPRQRRRLVSALAGNLQRVAESKEACAVVAAILSFCPPEEQRPLVEAVVAAEPEVRLQLQHGRAGAAIDRALSTFSGTARALENLGIAAGRLQGNEIEAPSPLTVGLLPVVRAPLPIIIAA